MSGGSGAHGKSGETWAPAPYPPETVRALSALTGDFYAREAASFSATRQAPWHGWERAWDIVTSGDSGLARRPLSVLDLGCGNLRFERFLAARAGGPLVFHAFDNCPALAANAEAPGRNRPAAVAVEFRELDITEALLAGTLGEALPRSACDLAVAFGLMHHLAVFGHRAAIVRGLVDALRPKGFAVLSFWQFLNDARIAAKARSTTDAGRASLELPPFAEHDFLLGWQRSEGVYRFCHHATDDEIDRIVDAARALGGGPCAARFREIARFSADGKKGGLNRYLVLQRA